MRQAREKLILWNFFRGFHHLNVVLVTLHFPGGFCGKNKTCVCSVGFHPKDRAPSFNKNVVLHLLLPPLDHFHFHIHKKGAER